MTWAQYLNMIYAMIAFNVGIFSFIFYWEFWRKRGKLKVRIKTPLGEKERWVKPESDGETLIIEKGSERKKVPEWKAKFSNKSLIRFTKWFGRMGFAVDIFYNAEKCIEYDYSLSEAEMPKFDKKTSKGYINAEVLKQRGRGLKQELPFIFWLVVILVFVNLVLSGLTAQRMGIF